MVASANSVHYRPLSPDGLAVLAIFQRQNASIIPAEYMSRTQEFLTRAAQGGNLCAAKILGFDLANGQSQFGIARNYDAAIPWLAKAADSGHVESMFLAGHAYRLASAGARNPSQAAYWYRRAAESGHAWAPFYLGAMHASGAGVSRSDVEALRWFRLGYDRGDRDATYRYGMAFIQGLGTPANNAEGQRLVRRAADLGHAEARNLVAQWNTTAASRRGVAPIDSATRIQMEMEERNRAFQECVNNAGMYAPEAAQGRCSGR